MDSRRILLAMLALALALRLLSPAGFMPAFDRGSVTIVACPDDMPAPPTEMHHHGKGKAAQQPCPYAAAAGWLSTLPDLATIVAALAFGAAVLSGRTFRFLEKHRVRERPPSRAPPLPA